MSTRLCLFVVQHSLDELLAHVVKVSHLQVGLFGRLWLGCVVVIRLVEFSFERSEALLDKQRLGLVKRLTAYGHAHVRVKSVELVVERARLKQIAILAQLVAPLYEMLLQLVGVAVELRVAVDLFVRVLAQVGLVFFELVVAYIFFLKTIRARMIFLNKTPSGFSEFTAAKSL